MKTFTIGWLNKCRCGNKSHAVKTARGNESALWDDDAVKCNSCGRGGVIQVCEGQARVLWETNEEMAEGKPMSTLTKEWLQQTIAELEEERDATPGAVNEDAANALAAMKLALASLEAEAVAQVLSSRAGNDTSTIDKALPEGTTLYTAPPAPVSVPNDEQCKPHPVMAVKGELGFLDHFDRIISDRDEDIDIGQLGSSNYEALMLAALDAFRAAIFQGAERGSNRDELTDVVNGLLAVMDEYPETLVPINRDSALVRQLRVAAGD